jgi:hypothetical protein
MNRLPASRRYKRHVVDITPCKVCATLFLDGGQVDDIGGLLANYMTAEDLAG